MKVPFLDLQAATNELRSELDEAYRRFMDSGWYILGEEVEAFESEYAEYCESEHCVGVGTGLDALTLALRAIDVGPGDEVIVPTNTYIATWLAVTQVGATIVPVEPDEQTYNINPTLIQSALTKKTKAIMPVNLYGQPFDYDAVTSIANDAGVKVVVDNAQGQGARYKGRRVGGIANIECHSFYPSKNLGAYGEAGAVTTRDPQIAERVRVLRNYGSKIRYHNDECGTNSRIDALQAAFLRVKLRHLDQWNARRKELARSYGMGLLKISQLQLPVVPEWADPVWHLFVIRLPHRNKLQERLTQRGIQTIIHYPIPPHLSKAYEALGYKRGDFPIAECLTDEVLSLPVGPHADPAHPNVVVTAIVDCLP
ncbi:DegT/DnrJ/EryC1/StrS family aminotransferase [Candidatus Laterigemmans baculatus]|uniref:DegT/DnrJ/EryC1/StrS family aminotransferase n=1 Tax=Candidatus Laterigemmans baculatus TaxID=2770505 RepID=UPI0013DD3EA5|nr:DegT/DnrJ/EryC1/StrS family aminotransferase [Candidatus Laterigemmans baculatus]